MTKAEVAVSRAKVLLNIVKANEVQKPIKITTTPTLRDVKKGDRLKVIGFFNGGMEETREGTVSRKVSDSEVFVKVDGKEYSAELTLYRMDFGGWEIIAYTKKSRAITRSASKAFRGLVKGG